MSLGVSGQQNHLRWADCFPRSFVGRFMERLVGRRAKYVDLVSREFLAAFRVFGILSSAVTHHDPAMRSGFAILNQVRTHHPHARSLLMDRGTLLEHESQWVREPRPANVHLTHLTPEEDELYRDLVEDICQPSLRLEQERIGFGAIQRALES
jgi:hypothetical protein